MKKVNRNYIDGAFVPVSGTETIELRNPANEEVIAEVLLSNEQDALRAIEAATQAFTTFSRSTVQERMDYLQQLHDAMVERLDDLKGATVIEYGATEQRALWANRYAADTFLYFKKVLADFSFERKMGESTVILEPVGVTALDDADLDTAIPMAVQNCFQNNGQACVAGSRLIVPEKLLSQVKELVVKTIATFRIGDPVDVQTTMGPLANAKQYERVQHYIRLGIESGAELIAGGPGKPEGLSKGYFVKPTAFVSTSHDIVIAREEIFGPVLTIVTYNTEDEAIRLANDTVYGLQAYISSSNPVRANAIARQIQAGRVLINTLQHDPYSPFGGFKQSGIGREGGIYGLEAQLEPKAVLD